VLARYPDGDKYVGKSADAPIFKKVLTEKTADAGLSVGLDNVERLYGYRPLGIDEKSPSAYVAVGIPSSEAFASLNQNFTNDLIALGLISLLSLALAWVVSDVLLVRRTNILLETTRKLSSGDLQIRTGLAHNHTELGELAQGLDEMAAQLEQQT